MAWQIHAECRGHSLATGIGHSRVCRPYRDRPSAITRELAAALCVAVLGTGGAGAALAGCGSGDAPVQAEIALGREHLIAAVHALESVQAPVAREVAATKSVWPAIAKGVPASPAPLRAQIEAAAASASMLRVPAPFGETESRALTGPAVAIAGTYRAFALLARSAWQLIAASARAIETGAAAVVGFARENVALYTESIYDAHFALAQIGKKVSKAFRDLGGSRAFGSALSQGQADALASFYSEANDRLTPRAAARLGS